MNAFDQKILVIGDSHVRAFSYNNHFIPLFIGPAAFNNFLTAETANHLKQKIAGLLSRVRDNHPKVLLLFSGDVEHTARKSAGYSGHEAQIIKESSSRYCEVFGELTEQFHGVEIIISATLPGSKTIYKQYQDLYNDHLRTFCQKANVKFLDVNDEISDEIGLLKYPYKADFAHISYRATRFFIQDLLTKKVLQPSPQSFVNDYQWEDVINIETHNGPYKIWGGIFRDELIIQDHEKLPLQNFQNRSKPTSDLLSEIIDFSSSYLDCHDFTFANCAEGFLVFEAFYKNRDLALNGFDLNAHRIANARCLGALAGTPGIHFEIGFEEIELKKIVIDFHQSGFKEEIRKELLKTYLTQSSYLFLLTQNYKSDERLLRKVGFTSVAHFPSHTPGHLVILAANEDLSKHLKKHSKALLKANAQGGLVRRVYRKIKNLIDRP